MPRSWTRFHLSTLLILTFLFAIWLGLTFQPHGCGLFSPTWAIYWYGWPMPMLFTSDPTIDARRQWVVLGCVINVGVLCTILGTTLYWCEYRKRPSPQ